MKIQHIECHQIELHLKTCRVDANRGLEELKRSIAENGQQQPVIVCGVSTDKWTLLDGYRRFEAVQRLEQDTILAEIWMCNESEGLMRMLGKESGRSRKALEEGRLIQSLVENHAIGFEEIAKRLGRSSRWVRGRLELVSEVDPSWWSKLEQGKLSVWALNRVLLPLKRLQKDHADQMVEHIGTKGISSRELARWWSHYKEGTHSKREKMSADPLLFLKALAQSENRSEAEQLRDGPEGECTRDSQILLAVGRRLNRKLGHLNENLDPLTTHEIHENLRALQKLLHRMEGPLKERKNANIQINSGNHPDPVEAGNGNQDDCEHPENLQEHRSEGKTGCQCLTEAQQEREGTPQPHSRTLPGVQREWSENPGNPGGQVQHYNGVFHTNTNHSRSPSAQGKKTGRHLPLRSGGRDAARHVPASPPDR